MVFVFRFLCHNLRFYLLTPTYLFTNSYVFVYQHLRFYLLRVL
nr:MAG TPA: hypothetical protein [Caudoviricetes sp.]